MSTQGFSYMLRYTVQPGHLTEQLLDRLVEFCKQARIADVMFFINGEELNDGHISREETKPWMEMIARGKKMLEPIGVTTSINPWITLLHADRGRKLKPDQHFRSMTDPNGMASLSVACPLCPDWRRYITDMYAYYATIKPDFLWVEDDFRLHNHEPLDWGGCFCDEHMREFARRAGVPELAREEFVRGVVAPGEPHDYRRIWLDMARETMVGLAREIAEAVHRVSPATRIGLMTSCPDVHAAEGRDWHGIFAAFDGFKDTEAEGRANGNGKGIGSNTGNGDNSGVQGAANLRREGKGAIIRPHLPAYSEDSGSKYWWRFSLVSRPTAALIPAHTEIYPELENFPFSLFSKSRTFQKFQLETSTLIGSRGITLNIFDMIGNGVYPEERYDVWLDEEKRFLDAIVALGLHVRDGTGVEVLMDEKSSYTLHTKDGMRMEELYPNETFWACLLSAYGITNRYTVNAEAARSGGVMKGSANCDAVAISGDYVRNLSEAAIRDIFANRVVLLEGEAVYALADMGLGELIGVSKVQWRHRNSGFQAYEQVVDGNEYVRLAQARMTAQMMVGSLLEIEYDGKSRVEEISEVRRPNGERACPGMTVVNGRVFIMPYGRFEDGGQSALLNPVRRAVLRDMLIRAAERPPLMVVSYDPYVSVHVYDSGNGGMTLAIVNASMDAVDEVEIAGTLNGTGLAEAFADADRWVAYSRQQPAGFLSDLKLIGSGQSSGSSGAELPAVNRDRLLLRGGFPALSLTVLHRPYK